MPELIWDKGLEAANKTEIEKHLKPFLWLVPGYLQDLKIDVRTSENEGLLASMTVSESYREATLTVRPLWFTTSDSCKTDTLIHELLHLHTNPLYDFAKNAIRKYSKNENEEQREIVFDEMECYLERATQDLTRVIYNKFKES